MGSTTQSLPDKVNDEIRKILNEIKQEQEQLELDRQILKEEKRILKSLNNIDVLRINVGGEIITATRQTLTKIHKSILSVLFNGRWEHKLQIDQNGNIFFDFNPILFRHLIDQLQTLDSNNQIRALSSFATFTCRTIQENAQKIRTRSVVIIRKEECHHI